MPFRTALALAASLSAVGGWAFDLTIIHSNDLHGRVEPVKIQGKEYGGYSRLATLVKRLRASEPNPLVLNAGDVFQGTLYFNVYQGMADLLFLRLIGLDAMGLGNHEFDLGPKPLLTFARSASFPLLACNLDLGQEPDLDALVAPSTVVEVGSEKIGVVGAVTPETEVSSSPGPTVKFLDLVTSVRAAVEALRLAGIDKIVLASHLGYPEEQRIAKAVAGIDVIVGAHSHSLLGDAGVASFPKPEGPYPTVVESAGAKTLVVSAWEWGKVLGRLRVTFDAAGNAVSWQGGPIAVDETIPKHPEAEALIAALQRPIADLRQQVVGEAAHALDGDRENVRRRETAMGNVIADAMLESAAATGAELALMNGGGIRAGIDAGPITFEEAIAVQPFGNTLAYLELRGEELLRAFEYGAAGIEEGKGSFLHVSRGVKLVLDLRKGPGGRVVSCELNGERLDPKRTYRIVTNTFTADGGDGFTVLRDAKGRRINLGTIDLDVLTAYLKKVRPVRTQVEGRVVVLGP